jgi:hypothetical protein
MLTPTRQHGVARNRTKHSNNPDIRLTVTVAGEGGIPSPKSHAGMIRGSDKTFKADDYRGRLMADG